MNNCTPQKIEDCKSYAELVDAIIAGAKKCVKRGEDQGKCHVFLEGDVCECSEIDLAKERMR